MQASVADVMEGRVTTSPAEIVEQPRGEVPVVAVDRFGDYGGAFRFGVFAGGEWCADVAYARRTAAGWDELGSGGSYGDGWTSPWRPPVDGWNGDDLYVMGSGGLDVEDEDEVPRELRVVYGFASPAVPAIEIVGSGAVRLIQIVSPVGAFAAVLVGEGEVELAALSGVAERQSTRAFSLRAYRS